MSIEDDIIVKREEWRVGRKVPINVYQGDAPVCQCHTPEMAQRIVDAMKSMTKPEGPAQEPQTVTLHVDYEACEVCGRAWPHSYKLHDSPTPVPATPAPSQPAGAREKNWLVDAVENCPDPVLKQNCKQLLGNDYTNAAVQLIADAQTAAKDALLHHVVMAVCDPREAVNGNLPTPAKAVELIIDRMHAAERERDSLASDLQGANKMIRDYDERLKALKAENAALKAGKEPKR